MQEHLQAELAGRGAPEEVAREGDELLAPFQVAAEHEETPRGIVREGFVGDGLEGGQVWDEIGGRGQLGRLKRRAQVAETAPGFGRQADLGLVEIANEIREVAGKATPELGIVDRVGEEGDELFARGLGRNGRALHVEEQANGGIGHGGVEGGNFVAPDRLQFFEEPREARGAFEVAAQPEQIVGEAARGVVGAVDEIGQRTDGRWRGRRAGVQDPRVLRQAAVLEGDDRVVAGGMEAREAAGHDAVFALLPRDERAEDVGGWPQGAFDPRGGGTEMDALLAAEGPRPRANIGRERFAFGAGEERTEPGGREMGGAEGGLDDERIEIFEHGVAGLFLAAPPGGDAGQREFFAEHFPAKGIEKREQRRSFDGPAPELVGERDALVVGGVHEAGHAEQGVAVQFERIAERGVDAADNRIDAAEAADGAQEDLGIARGEIGALDEGEAEVAGEVGVFEIGLVRRSGREENDARFLAGPDVGQLFERDAEAAEKFVEPLDGRAAENLGERLAGENAVLQRVAEARGRIEAVPEHPPSAVGRAGEIDRIGVEHDVALPPEPDARTEELGIGQRERGGERPAAEEFLRTVEIAQQVVEEPGALAQAVAEHRPVLGGNEQRHDIERPDLGARALAVVDVHAHVLLDDGALAGGVGGAEGGGGVGPEVPEKLRPRRPDRAVRRAIFVVTPRRGDVAGEGIGDGGGGGCG